MKEKIIIVGAGGFGRELYDMLWDVFDQNTHEFKGFLAQDDSSLTQAGLELPWLGDPEEYEPSEQDRFLMAIGYMDVRRRVYETLRQRGAEFPPFIHPRSLIASTAKIGPGAVIYPFATVSNGSVLNDDVHLNYYASAGHDCQLGKHCLLAPYATLNGFVELADEVYLATHATVAPGKKIGYRSKLSSNSAAMQDVPENQIVFGVPGRQVKRMD